jgi:hypothetical protein
MRTFYTAAAAVATALFCVTFQTNAQTIKPSQIITLYSDFSICGTNFCLKDTIHGTNGDEPWNVPKGKIFMLTDISVDFTDTNFWTVARAIHVQGLNEAKPIVATYFNIGYGRQVNQTFTTPIPIHNDSILSHDIAATNGEVILRGYLTGND